MLTEELEEEDIVTRSGLIEDGEYDDGKDNSGSGGNDWEDMWW